MGANINLMTITHTAVRAVRTDDNGPVSSTEVIHYHTCGGPPRSCTSVQGFLDLRVNSMAIYIYAWRPPICRSAQNDGCAAQTNPTPDLVVLTLTRIIKSVVTGQAPVACDPITLFRLLFSLSSLFFPFLSLLIWSLFLVSN